MMPDLGESAVVAPDIKIVPDDVSLRQYIEAILNEQRRGLIVAEQEREKAASVLREHLEAEIAVGDRNLRDMLATSTAEARRALEVAEQEREKTAQALRTDLARATSEGDRSLRDHIEQQVIQISQSQVSAEKLEIARFDSVAKRADVLEEMVTRRFSQTVDTMNAADVQLRTSINKLADITIDNRNADEESFKERIAALRNEVLLIQRAAEDGVRKQESATEKRFQSVNEFRAQLATIISGTMPREVAEAQIHDLSAQIARLQTRLDTRDGEREARQEARQNGQPIVLWAGTTLIALIGLIVVGVGAFT